MVHASQKGGKEAVFLDYDGIIYYKFIPEGLIVNKEIYLEIFK